MLNHLIMLYGLTSLTTLLIDMDIILPQDQKYGNKLVCHTYVCGSMYIITLHTSVQRNV